MPHEGIHNQMHFVRDCAANIILLCLIGKEKPKKCWENLIFPFFLSFYYPYKEQKEEETAIAAFSSCWLLKENSY